ncbi:MAG: hypothetical protein ACPG4Y_05525 [Chitinophagales bacterium]
MKILSINEFMNEGRRQRFINFKSGRKKFKLELLYNTYGTASALYGYNVEEYSEHWLKEAIRNSKISKSELKELLLMDDEPYIEINVRNYISLDRTIDVTIILNGEELDTFTTSAPMTF